MLERNKKPRLTQFQRVELQDYLKVGITKIRANLRENSRFRAVTLVKLARFFSQIDQLNTYFQLPFLQYKIYRQIQLLSFT